MLLRKKEKGGEKIRSRVELYICISFHICRVSACDLYSTVRTDNVTRPFSIFAWPVTTGRFKSLKKSSCSQLTILFVVHLRKRNRSYVVMQKLLAWQEILVWTARDFSAPFFFVRRIQCFFPAACETFLLLGVLCFMEFELDISATVASEWHGSCIQYLHILDSDYMIRVG